MVPRAWKAELDLLRKELSTMQDVLQPQAPQEVREMEDYVDKLDATHAELQEALADLSMQMQAARVLIQRLQPKAGLPCEKCLRLGSKAAKTC